MSYLLKLVQDEAGKEHYETTLSGSELLLHPLLNKGSAFTTTEREEFNLTNRLPSTPGTLEHQIQRSYEQYNAIDNDLAKNSFLNSKHDQNVVLFFRLLVEHIEEMMPIIYTPTEGKAIQNYSHEFRRPAGIFLKADDDITAAFTQHDVDLDNIELVVVTDAEQILGIGDQGVGGIGISVAKAVVYSLCAGIHPAKMLPVMLDVGTNNPELFKDPMYLGLRQPRLKQQQYDAFIDKFVTAVKTTFPKAYLHWEDFGLNNARRILDKYRHQLLTFNDDMLGTGAVATAAFIAASKAINKKTTEHKFVIFGSGTAGTGIADQLVHLMVKEGLPKAEAVSRIWCVDKQGLLTEDMGGLTPYQQVYARKLAEVKDCQKNTQGMIDLEKTVAHIKPTVLIGTSTHPNSFTEKVVTTMAKFCERPLIFPLSNPTPLAEATPEQIINWTKGKAYVTTGSPFDPVSFNGNSFVIGECNNSFFYPGFALGAICAGAQHVSDNMLLAGIYALAEEAPVLHNPYEALMPALTDVRAVSRKIAITVYKQAHKDGLATKGTEKDANKIIDSNTWEPKYAPIKVVKHF